LDWCRRYRRDRRWPVRGDRAGLSANANKTANEALEIEQAAEHERLAPRLDFAFREVVSGSGVTYTLTVDRNVESLALTLVRGVDQAADDNIIGLTEGAAPGPVGTLSSKLDLSGVPAGGARPITLWASDLSRAGGATVRLRSQARRGDRIWNDLLNDIAIPADVAGPVR
jgi:hypothetical protein